jgi:hypothetical protein
MTLARCLRLPWTAPRLGLPLCLALLLAIPLAGCGGGGVSGSGGTATTTTSTTTSTSSTSETGGAGGAAMTTSSSTGGSGGTGGGPPMIHSVTFTYEPGWAGVSGIDVVGGFGKAGDWKSASPLVGLKDDGTGKWSATVDLPEGKYLYVYRIKGDSAGPDTFVRYSLDPTVTVASACPPESPTFSNTSTNPCATITSPQPAAAPVHHITGKVVYGGVPAAGYPVVLDSDETDFGPYFENRTTSAADGTFDLTTANGMFRIQVQHPTYLTLNDAERDPYTLKAFRRTVSSSFFVGNPVALLDAEMEYADYDKMLPTATASLPTTFEITIAAGHDTARVAVYGGTDPMTPLVGNAWFQSDNLAATSVPFDGTFNQPSAVGAAVIPGDQYYWGTYQYRTAGVGKTWRGQTMVLPITWN